jgi:hypothetical protein
MPVAVAGRVASISHPANRGQLPKIAELAAAMDGSASATASPGRTAS